jgi:ribosomal protein S18 acetylase RimI-like enzyme
VKITNKTNTLHNTLRELSDLCFTGIEVPTEAEFRLHFDKDDVFVNLAKRGNLFAEAAVEAYAIVDNRLSRPFIWQIATDPAYRGRGFASSLLQEIEKYYTPTATNIELAVRQDNLTAQMTYLKNGYVFAALLKNFYGHQVNGVLMRRNL